MCCHHIIGAACVGLGGIIFVAALVKTRSLKAAWRQAYETARRIINGIAPI